MAALSPMVKIGFIRRKECWSLTLRGWLTLLLCALVVIVVGVQSVFPFLAVNQPVKGEILVVEGWVPDYSVKQVRSEFIKGGYSLLIVTGGPIIKGEMCAEFKTYAELTKAILQRNGFDEDKLVAVPSEERFRNRTYASALALREWISKSGLAVKSLNVFTRSAHARRTWLLFEKAFQGRIEVGIIAGDDLRYDGKRWWRSSEGVRDILDEAIAYLYARFLFYPR